MKLGHEAHYVTKITFVLTHKQTPAEVYFRQKQGLLFTRAILGFN